MKRPLHSRSPEWTGVATQSYKRADRVAERIQAEVSTIISREVQDPRIGLVTIMKVTLTDDLGLARVFIRAGAGAEQKKALAGLRKAAGFIRSTLATRMALRRVPSLVFLVDTQTDKTTHLLDLLDQISRPIDKTPPDEPEQDAPEQGDPE